MMVNKMIVEAIHIEDIKATKVTRMGGPRKDGKPRVLLVALNDDRMRILRKARYVRMYDEWENVYIDPDRTPQERKEHALKRQRLKAQRQEAVSRSESEDEESETEVDEGDQTVLPSGNIVDSSRVVVGPVVHFLTSCVESEQTTTTP